MAGRTRTLRCIGIVALLAAGLLTVLPAGPAQETEGNLIIDDPAGDQGPFGIGLIGNPAPETWGIADIVRVEVGNEDAESYEILLHMVGPDGPAATVGRALAVFDFACDVRFHHGSDYSDPAGYGYAVSFDSNILDMPTEEPGPPIVDAYLSGWGPGYDAFADLTDGITVTYEPDTKVFRVHILKAFTPVFPGARNPGLGDHLYLERVYCRTDTLLYFGWGDDVDTDGPRYNFNGPRSDGVIDIAFVEDGAQDGMQTGGGLPMDWTPPGPGTGGAPQTSVAPDATTPIPLRLTNTAESRKLVQLSVRAAEGSGTGWNLTITPSLFLAPGENRTVNLIAKPPPGAGAGLLQPIEVVATLAGESAVSVAPRTLKVIPVFGAGANTIYLHTKMSQSSHPLAPVINTLSPPYEYGASFLRDDPAWPDPETTLSPLFTAGDSVELDPLVRPVTIDPEQPVQLTVAFSGGADAPVRVRVVLYSDTLGTIFDFDRTVAAEGVHTLETYVNEAGLLLPAGTQLTLNVDFWRPFGEPPTTDVTFDPRASHLVVPATVYAAAEVTLTDGTFLPALQLARGEDRTAYLNPGKVYAYELVLANEGLETDDLVLSVNATNATGWQVGIEPGTKYRITPGNSTPVGVVVRAPTGVQEGHKAELVVTAQSTHDAGAYSRIRLQAIATNGVDIDEKTYGEKENQIAPLVDRKGSPALPALGVVLAGAALLAAWRRRALP